MRTKCHQRSYLLVRVIAAAHRVRVDAALVLDMILVRVFGLSFDGGAVRICGRRRIEDIPFFEIPFLVRREGSRGSQSPRFVSLVLVTASLQPHAFASLDNTQQFYSCHFSDKMGVLDGFFGSEGGGGEDKAGDILGGAASQGPTAGGERETDVN